MSTDRPAAPLVARVRRPGTGPNDLVPVVESLRAECSLCDWVGKDFSDIGWVDCEVEALDHLESEHPWEDEPLEDWQAEALGDGFGRC